MASRRGPTRRRVETSAAAQETTLTSKMGISTATANSIKTVASTFGALAQQLPPWQYEPSGRQGVTASCVAAASATMTASRRTTPTPPATVEGVVTVRYPTDAIQPRQRSTPFDLVKLLGEAAVRGDAAQLETGKVVPTYQRLSRLKYSTAAVRAANVRATAAHPDDGVCTCDRLDAQPLPPKPAEPTSSTLSSSKTTRKQEQLSSTTASTSSSSPPTTQDCGSNCASWSNLRTLLSRWIFVRLLSRCTQTV